MVARFTTFDSSNEEIGCKMSGFVLYVGRDGERDGCDDVWGQGG